MLYFSKSSHESSGPWSDSQFSVFLSHECSEEEEDSEPCKKGENIPKTQLTDIKEDENDLKENYN